MDTEGYGYAIVNVVRGPISSMTICSFPSQLPHHISKYRYVWHYWTIDALGTGWVADIEFHYWDSEVLSGGVMDEYALRAMRIAPGTAFWEDPIIGTNSTPDAMGNYVYVTNFNPTNYEGEIALAHEWAPEEEKGIAAGIPTEYTLEQNYPNPFNPTTEIRFGLPEDQHVSLIVMNALGEEVARLVDADLAAGYHTATFNATNLGSGMYMYMLKSGNFTRTRTMIIGK